MQEQEQKSYDNEIFIDADDGFASEKNSYENLILRQMLECTKTLSKEMIGGQITQRVTSTGATEKYTEDVRELVINHIDVLEALLDSWVKGGNKTQLEIIKKEIEDYKKEIGEILIEVPKKGKIKIKDIKGFNADHPIWKEFVNFKSQKYREIFRILVRSYNDEKAYIRSLEEE